MKSLIVYFSWSNNTKNLVESINKFLNFDVVRIEKEIPYSEDYNQCAYVEAKEEVDKNIHPAIKKMNINVNEYDRILLFFPIWWYTIPMPVATFVEEYLVNYKGEVLLFANSYTNDPQYTENSLRDLKEINGSINFKNALFNKSVREHLKYLS